MDAHAAGTADEAHALKQEEDLQMEKVRTQIDAPKLRARERAMSDCLYGSHLHLAAVRCVRC
jgi:hypothetical protein